VTCKTTHLLHTPLRRYGHEKLPAQKGRYVNGRHWQRDREVLQALPIRLSEVAMLSSLHRACWHGKLSRCLSSADDKLTNRHFYAVSCSRSLRSRPRWTSQSPSFFHGTKLSWRDPQDVTCPGYSRHVLKMYQLSKSSWLVSMRCTLTNSQDTTPCAFLDVV
jgi:hypothetical protein